MSKQERELQRIVRLRYWKRGEAAVVVSAWRQSGNTVAGFCRHWKIDDNRLARWIHLLEQPASKSETTSMTFHRVQLLDPTKAEDHTGGATEEYQWVAELRHACWTVRVPYGFEDVIVLDQVGCKVDGLSPVCLEVHLLARKPWNADGDFVRSAIIGSVREQSRNRVQDCKK